METDQVLAEQRWSYVLFRRNGAYLFTFLSGGPVEIDYTIVLSEADALAISQDTVRASVLIGDLLADREKLLSHCLPEPIWPPSNNSFKPTPQSGAA